jgi:hypothetical protein
MAATGVARKRKVIEPTAEDLSNIEFETSEEVEVLPTFDSMGLREELLRGIYSYGKVGKKVEWGDVWVCRIRETVRDPATVDQAHRERTRCDCTVSRFKSRS